MLLPYSHATYSGGHHICHTTSWIGRILFIRPDKEYTALSSDRRMNSVIVDEDIEIAIEPRAGRVVVFTAGMENTHFVERVLSGQRFVLSFWFTCNQKREFPIFLDGKAHTAFSQKIRDSSNAASGGSNRSQKKDRRGSSRSDRRTAVGSNDL